MRRLFAPLILLALTSSACLEGDPNPYDHDETSTGNTNSGGSAGGGGVNSGGSTGKLSPVQGSQCSGASVQTVSLTFHNRSQRALRVFWVDFSCQEKLYADVPAGQSYNVSTFASHVWRLRDLVTSSLQGEYVATTTPNQDVDTLP
jgi:hypothetical protein